MKVGYFTNIAPHYREKLWRLLIDDSQIDVEFYFDKNDKGSIEKIDFKSKFWSKGKLGKLNHNENIKIKWPKKVVIWQKGILRISINKNYDAVIFLGDMYILSTWLSALLFRIRGKRVIFWSHGFYGNESFLKGKLRSLFKSLAHQHLLYGHRAKNIMAKKGFDHTRLNVIYNSLDYDKHFNIRRKLKEYDSPSKITFFEDNKKPLLIFVGRLTPEKKIDLLINAIQEINKSKIKYNILLIGDGREIQKLKTLADDGLGKYIHFLGACYDDEVIGKYLYFADLCVSPGNVGLTAIHSLTFGTPVLTHNNFSNQMPEFESIKEDLTGCFFEENNSHHLAIKIEQWFEKSRDRNEIREECFKVVDDYYNPYKQLNILKEVLNTNL